MNFLSFTDPVVKSSKNLLQAELCSTLQRRKNNNKNVRKQSENEENNTDEICSASIIDFKNPNYITPKNSTITAIRKQTSELKAARATNNNLSDQKLITNIAELAAKLPDSESLMDEINRIQQQQIANKDKQPVEKRMISHGKPNFIIKSVNPIVKAKFEQPVEKNNQSNNNINSVQKSDKDMVEKNEKPLIPPSPPIRTNESSQSVIDLQKKLKNLQTIDAPTVINPSPKPFRKYDTLPLRQQPKSLPPSVSIGLKASNNGFVQNKLKILQNNEAKQSSPPPLKISLTPKCSPTPFRKFHGLHVQTTTTITTNNGENSVGNLEQFKSSPVSPRRALLFKQQKNILCSQVTSPPAIHHLQHSNDTTEKDKFSATKPSTNNVIVSFSKELSNAPNRYPDQIKITKSTENSTTNSIGHKQQQFLSDIKFIIDSNGSVETVMQK